MNNQTALAALSEKYKDCNLLLPVATEAQLNPFYKMTVMEVRANTQEGAGDIFKVGTINVNNAWVAQYSPAKPLLMKIAAAAGIQFDPDHTYGTYVDGNKNVYRAKAYGALRLPDGTGKTHCDEKVINLSDEEDKFRLEFMDKSIQGITDKKQAEEAAKLFQGEWKDGVDKYNKSCKVFYIADSDQKKYIERGVLVNMTLLRKTMAEKAMTGAILRVIRALTGLKGTYTVEELQKPFAIPRVTFSPDFNDPEVRRAMMAQGMNAVGSMFGGTLPTTTPIIEGHAVVSDFDPDVFADNAAFQSDQPIDPQPEYAPQGEPEPANESPSLFSQQQPSRGATSPAPGSTTAAGPVCSNCGRAISSAVADFSQRKHGRNLCRECQPN